MKSTLVRILTSIAAASAVFSLLSCGGSGTFSPALAGGGQQAEVSVTVTPSNPTVLTDGSQQFTAMVTNTSNSAVQWSISSNTQGDIGSISSTGLYKAPNSVPRIGATSKTRSRQPPGTSGITVTVTATSLAQPSAFGTAAITLQQANVTVTVSPQDPSIITNEQKQFTATVTGTNNTAVTWSVSAPEGGDPGTISSTGLYTAPENAPATRAKAKPGSKNAPGNTSGTVIITATSTAFPSASGSSTATIING